jgi:hypothetical protein
MDQRVGDPAAQDETGHSVIGHNSGDVTVKVSLRLFNSLTRFREGDEPVSEFELEAGATVGDLARRLRIPIDALYLVLVNGRDVTPGLIGTRVRDYHVLEDGDRVAFSGAVPYSFGYGAPVV